MLKKIDLYIIKKFLGTFFFSIIIIISISIVFDLSEKFERFMMHDAKLADILFVYYANFIPYYVTLFGALFTFISVIFFSAKLAERTEIVAMLGSGMSYGRILRPYMISASVIAAILYVMGTTVLPPSNKNRIEYEEAYVRTVKYVHRDTNIHIQLDPDLYISMYKFDNWKNIGYKFAIEKFKDNQLQSKILANTVTWDSLSKNWVLHDYQKRIFENGKQVSFSTGTQLDTTLSMHPSEFNYRRENHFETMTNPELDEFMDKLKFRGQPVERYQVEKYRRVAAPFAVFILTLIGAALTTRKVRGGIGGFIGVGILLSFSYIFMMHVATQVAIGLKGYSLLAVWTPNILYGIIAVVLIRFAQK